MNTESALRKDFPHRDIIGIQYLKKPIFLSAILVLKNKIHAYEAAENKSYLWSF